MSNLTLSYRIVAKQNLNDFISVTVVPEFAPNPEKQL